ncbi:hypothetical protein HDV06_002927 [Boothiomyces sp. JEL0866]|nr:hypothetical protein HDV06_002927 [Boothiomyces sp. JEL0866]
MEAITITFLSVSTLLKGLALWKCLLSENRKKSYTITFIFFHLIGLLGNFQRYYVVIRAIVAGNRTGYIPELENGLLIATAELEIFFIIYADIQTFRIFAVLFTYFTDKVFIASHVLNAISAILGLVLHLLCAFYPAYNLVTEINPVNRDCPALSNIGDTHYG